MAYKPQCLFLQSRYELEHVFPGVLLERLSSIVDIVSANGQAGEIPEGIRICVSWDDSPPVARIHSSLRLIVHCGFNPQTVFPTLAIPSPWERRPGPRAWDRAGLKPEGGGRWGTGTRTELIPSSELNLVSISEPIERTIAEKLLAITVMATCGDRAGIVNWENGFSRDFYDLCIGFLGCGGAAAALARLLRNYEVGLCIYEPDFYPQQVNELGAEYLDDLTELGDRADCTIVFPFKKPGRRVSEADVAQSLKSNPVIIVNEDLVAEWNLAGLSRDVIVCCPTGSHSGRTSNERRTGRIQQNAQQNVRYLRGLEELNANSLNRVGKTVLDAIYHHAATRDMQ